MGSEGRGRNFVTPYGEGERRWTEAGPVQVAAPMAAPELVRVTPVEVLPPAADGSKDALSAVDRAKALRIRAHPVWWLVLAGACAATLAYWLAANAAGFRAAYNLDKLLVFAAALTVAGLVTYLRLNRLDFDHSRAGVERFRLETYAEVRKAELEAELAIRSKALEASVRLLEERRRE